LRVTAPVDFHHLLAPVVASFINAHPEVNVELRLSNRPMDIVDEGIDVALRIASPNLEGDLIARLLAPVSVVTVASPGYLKRRGRPRRPQDLEKHRTLVFVEPRPRLCWTYERGRKRVEVTLSPVLLCNGGTALLSAAAADAGIVMVPSFNLGSFVSDGALEEILTDWKIVPDLRLYAVYPHRRFLSPNVAHFVEALRTAFGQAESDPLSSRLAKSATSPTKQLAK
jgi:DNA-binding transcriptional LysR family regulator